MTNLVRVGLARLRENLNDHEKWLARHFSPGTSYRVMAIGEDDLVYLGPMWMTDADVARFDIAEEMEDPVLRFGCVRPIFGSFVEHSYSFAQAAE